MFLFRSNLNFQLRACNLLKGINKLYTTESISKNILHLKDRGMFQEIFPDSSEVCIQKLISKNPQAVYAGFDPTADSLHVGSLLVLMNLLHWQRCGHRVFAVVGGATGLIGDPSYRSKERDEIDHSTIEKNILGIKKDIETVFENHSKYFSPRPLNPIIILNNVDWYRDEKLIDFIKNIGRHFRLGTMLGKTSVQERLKSETGMSFTEFSYQILQAYDWLHLLKNYNCHFQIGGSDQLGNIIAGHELISRTVKKDVYGLTLPLITSGGKKFGKSVGNAVWLSPYKSSSFDLYQFFMRTPDSAVEKYLEFFTFLSLEEINQIMETHNKDPELHVAQKLLADNVVLLLHGEEGLFKAKQATSILYDNSADLLSTMDPNEVVKALTGANIVHIPPQPGISMYQLALKANCFKTEKDALRIIQAGGFYVNYERITDGKEIVKDGKHILANNITLLRTGKKTYHLVRWLQ